jgi:adenylate cyclase class 2
LEIEVKVPVQDVREYAERAKSLGYESIRSRHFEANTLFDYPDRSLSVAGCLLRVRETRQSALFTFKGKLVEDERFKIRPETETICDSGPNLRAILENIGLRPFFRYEKYREEYRAPGAMLCCDELPFGHFLELEGSPQGIEDLAQVLGLDPATFIRRSYADLYGEHCRKRALPFGDIVFKSDEERP